MATIGYIAYEAGAAAAMAPVWRASRHDRRVGLSAAPALHMPLPEAFSLEGHERADPGWLEGIDVLVLSATARKIEGELIEMAAARSVPVIQVVDIWGVYWPRFAHGMGRWIAVPDRFAAEAADADGVPRERLRATGNPAWDSPPPLPAGDPGTLVFLGQPLRRLFGSGLGYDELDALQLLREARRMRPDLIRKLIVVPHPAGDATAEAGGDEPRMTLDPALAEAGMVGGMFTSALIEAVLGGRPVVSVQPGLPADDRCHLSARGWIRRIGAAEYFAGGLAVSEKGRQALSEAMAGSTARFLALIEETLSECVLSA